MVVVCRKKNVLKVRHEFYIYNNTVEKSMLAIVKKKKKKKKVMERLKLIKTKQNEAKQ